MLSKRNLKTTEPCKVRARFVNCCASLSGPKWKVDKTFCVYNCDTQQEEEKTKDSITVPPCTAVQVRYTVKVTREGKYKLCIFTLLKLWSDKTQTCEFIIEVKINGVIIGTVPIQVDLDKDHLVCKEICECFEINAPPTETLTFNITGDCELEYQPECSCSIDTPLPLDPTTPDCVHVVDTVYLGDDEYTLASAVICDTTEAFSFTDACADTNFTYCRIFPSVEECGEDRCFRNVVKLTNDDGCILDKASADLTIKCCPLELKVFPPKVICDINWCICKDAQVITEGPPEHPTKCIQYTVSLNKSEHGVTVVGGGFILKGCDDKFNDHLYDGDVAITDGPANNGEFNLNTFVTWSDVPIDLTQQLGEELCVRVELFHYTYNLCTGESTKDETTDTCGNYKECVIIPKCEQKLTFCEKFTFSDLDCGPSQLILSNCVDVDAYPTEYGWVQALITKFSSNPLTTEQCVSLVGLPDTQQDIVLCYKLCIPEECCNDHGKICVTNHAKIRSDPCDGNDLDACAHAFENTASTSTIVPCKLCLQSHVGNVRQVRRHMNVLKK